MRFQDGIRELRNMIGTGDLVGEVVVDQPYAEIQHERLDFRHPRGGEAKYLENPLKEKERRYFAAMSNGLLTRGGLIQNMTESMEDLAGEVGRRAPILIGDLRASGSPRVYDDGRLVFRRG